MLARFFAWKFYPIYISEIPLNLHVKILPLFSLRKNSFLTLLFYRFLPLIGRFSSFCLLFVTAASLAALLPHPVASRIIGKLSGLTNCLVYHLFIDFVILFCPDCSHYVKPIVKKMIFAINLYQKGLLWLVFCKSVHGFVKLVWPHYHRATNHIVL